MRCCLLDHRPDDRRDGGVEEQVGQVEDVLRDGSVAEELGNGVGEVVAVVLEQVVSISTKLEQLVKSGYG